MGFPRRFQGSSYSSDSAVGSDARLLRTRLGAHLAEKGLQSHQSAEIDERPSHRGDQLHPLGSQGNYQSQRGIATAHFWWVISFDFFFAKNFLEPTDRLTNLTFRKSSNHGNVVECFLEGGGMFSMTAG